jgi:transposase-like protein
MNIYTIQEKYGTKDKCIRHLEKIRWGNKPVCPDCESDRITKSTRPYYYHCNACNRNFTVLKGTIFEASKLPLPKWFMIIGLMLSAKKGISASQISRTTGVTYKTAWFTAMRIRCALVDESELLEGVVEMDEVYIGGRPRYRNQKSANSSTTITTLEKSKRGRGTKKIPVVGIVQRRGQARLKIMDRLTTKNMLAMLKKNVNMKKSELMTDEFRSYHSIDKFMTHHVIKHVEKEYARGKIHTNTIEGLWSIIKNGIRGQYHALSRKYLPFYLVEFTYKFNHRYYKPKSGSEFQETIEKSVEDKKCLVRYKPNRYAAKITRRHQAGKKVEPETGHCPAKRKYRKRKKVKPVSKKRKKVKPNNKKRMVRRNKKAARK